MEVVTSRDGTRIAFLRGGHGPPLLLVHPTTADHTTTWRMVLPALQERFTVCAMDRRGRGGSGDASAYELAREAEDVAAVVHALEQPVNVLGHSYGALCALEATLRSTGIQKLVLYEGVPLRGADLYRPGLIERLEAMVQAGDAGGALVALMRDVVGMTEEEIGAIRAQTGAWARRISNASTIARELRAEAEYVFLPERFGSMRSPTLLLVGEESPAREMTHARRVASALPDARIVVLPGQQHAAMYTAPDMFVQEVARFLTE